MTDFVRSLLRNIEHQSATLLYFGITVTKSKLMVDIQSPPVPLIIIAEDIRFILILKRKTGRLIFNLPH